MPDTVKTTDKVKPDDLKMDRTTDRIRKLVGMYHRLKGQRSNFESYWQSLHDYFYIEAQNVNRTYYPGTELNVDYLFDSTTLEAADVLASGFMNYLTPPTSRWFGLRATNPAFEGNQKIARYLEDVTDQVMHAFNRSNYYNQMFPAYKSSGVYGTSAVLAEEDNEDDVRFFNIPIKQVCIVEDGRGRVVEYYIEFEFTAYQAASRWGEENLPVKMREELGVERNQDKKYQYILFIGNRHIRDVRSQTKENLPIEALWIDVANFMVMEEGGYNEFPAMCHRFDKRPTMPWGFSPAMKALPTARLLNAAAKTTMRAQMKHTDPPIAIPDNAFLMPLNANPRAINYYNKSKLDASKDIATFGNYGNIEVGMKSVEYYAGQVRSLMYNDTFLAFNQITKQMNNPEIMERINEKMTLLGPAVGRYISEMLSPTIIRVIGILQRKGKLPPPPEEFLMDPQYEIDFLSQLAQAQRRSELNSLVTGLTLVGQMAEFNPNVLHKIDSDKAVDEVWAIVGAPAKVLRDKEEVKTMREATAQAAARQEEMNLVQQGAESMSKGSQAGLNEAKTQTELKKP